MRKPKICVICGKEYIKLRISEKQWQKSLYCGRPCLNKSKVGKKFVKKKKTQWGI